MKIINLTPHPVIILNNNKKVIMHLEPSGEVARVTKITEQVDHLGAIPVSRARFGKIKGLPDAGRNCVYVVSKMVHEAANGRNDLYYPAEKVSEGNRVIGCRSLGSK